MHVIVVGGAGYVGRFVCCALVRRGHQVTVVVRGPGEIHVAGTGAGVCRNDEIAQLEQSDVVINLAFPNDGPPIEDPARNQAILDLVGQSAGTSARVILVSTLAVFGYNLESPQVAASTPRRRDVPYIEAKISAEHEFSRAFGRRLTVLRLGNVWGPASASWTAAIADCLLFGEPVGVRDADGFSNATDVANAADLLAFLAEASDLGGRYYHLAELGAMRWTELIAPLARALHVDPILARERPDEAGSLAEEVLEALRGRGPLSLVRTLAERPIAGSYVRSVARVAPPALLRALRRRPNFTASQSDGADADMLRVLSCPRQFETVVPGEWIPPVSWNESWRAVSSWLQRAGYTETDAGEEP